MCTCRINSHKYGVVYHLVSYIVQLFYRRQHPTPLGFCCLHTFFLTSVFLHPPPFLDPPTKVFWRIPSTQQGLLFALHTRLPCSGVPCPCSNILLRPCLVCAQRELSRSLSLPGPLSRARGHLIFDMPTDGMHPPPPVEYTNIGAAAGDNIERSSYVKQIIVWTLTCTHFTS